MASKTTKIPTKKLYRVRFLNEGRIFELYARDVGQGMLFGFVEIADLVWGSKSEVIIDPGEQELRNEFNGVNRLHVPMHAMVRIDEVEKSGSAKIIPLQGAPRRRRRRPCRSTRRAGRRPSSPSSEERGALDREVVRRPAAFAAIVGSGVHAELLEDAPRGDVGLVGAAAARARSPSSANAWRRTAAAASVARPAPQRAGSMLYSISTLRGALDRPQAAAADQRPGRVGEHPQAVARPCEVGVARGEHRAHGVRARPPDRPTGSVAPPASFQCACRAATSSVAHRVGSAERGLCGAGSRTLPSKHGAGARRAAPVRGSIVRRAERRLSRAWEESQMRWVVVTMLACTMSLGFGGSASAKKVPCKKIKEAVGERQDPGADRRGAWARA